MNFCDIAKALGIETYPEALDKIYESLPEKCEVFDIDYLKAFHEKCGALGEHADVILASADDIKADENLYTYARCVIEYVRDCDIVEARSVKMPAPDGTRARDMMPLFILLSMVPGMIEEYTRRGFSKDELDFIIKTVPNSIDVVNERFNIFGINQGFYNWLCVYTKCKIFNHRVFGAELRHFPDYAIMLKNRTTAEHIILMCGGKFHRDGHVLGSAGFADTEGAFDADYRETDEAYIGHAAVNGFVSKEFTTCKKSEWEVVLKPGDGIVSLHIPKGRDLSHDNVVQSVKECLETAWERFPEFCPKAAFCASWLLDPTIIDLLGESSKIVGFGNCFLRFPNKSAGHELFSFVYPGFDPMNYAALPEDTTLQRKAKQHYLDGKFIHAFSGVFIG